MGLQTHGFGIKAIACCRHPGIAGAIHRACSTDVICETYHGAEPPCWSCILPTADSFCGSRDETVFLLGSPSLKDTGNNHTRVNFGVHPEAHQHLEDRRGQLDHQWLVPDGIAEQFVGPLGGGRRGNAGWRGPGGMMRCPTPPPAIVTRSCTPPGTRRKSKKVPGDEAISRCLPIIKQSVWLTIPQIDARHIPHAPERHAGGAGRFAWMVCHVQTMRPPPPAVCHARS